MAAAAGMMCRGSEVVERHAGIRPRDRRKRRRMNVRFRVEMMLRCGGSADEVDVKMAAGRIDQVS